MIGVCTNTGRTWFKKGYAPWNKGKKGVQIPWNKGLIGWDNGVFKKLNINTRGENNGNWKGGITPINDLIRGSSKYQKWRKAVFLRDYFTCVLCGFKNKETRPSDIQADHIKLFALYPELRFKLSNGRTLCVPCHKQRR